MEVANQLVKGGEFIIKETDAQDVFTPADFSGEQNMMHQTALDFVEKEVTPLLEQRRSLGLVWSRPRRRCQRI